MLNYFDQVACISLSSREDRRRETNHELRRHNLNPAQIDWWLAEKPGTIPENWISYSKGVYGCFQSHLGVLKRFLESSHKTLLVLEDDILFINPASNWLKQFPLEWDMIYFGRSNMNANKSNNGWRLLTNDHVQGCYAYAVTRRGASMLVEFLELAMKRQDGHVEGGPQHVDGCYTMGRRQYGTNFKTWILEPYVCHYRSSKTDIHETKMRYVSELPVVGKFLALGRRCKNWMITLNVANIIDYFNW